MNAGLLLRPEWFDGLQFGVSLYRDRLTLSDTSKALIHETIAVDHLAYKTDVGVRYDFEALAVRKVQTSHLKQTTRPTMNRFDAQLSCMF
jgi:hypothetical protein